MTENFQKKIQDLETRLAFQDDLLDAMNRSISEQNERIRILELAYRDLAKQVRDGDSEINTGEERPPHY
jgi:SlyX protein